VALFYVWFAQLLCKDGQCWNIPIGSFLLTCSWLNLTSYGSQMPFLGIYILMLRQIVETILKLSTLIVIFLIAFGLGFHVIFSKLDTFAAVEWSLLKTIVMMIGELDYGDIFFNEDVDPLSDVSTGYAVFLFVTFLLIMTIIMMNLITGLALDDIQKIAENAEFKNLSMQVELVLGLERLHKNLRFWSSDNKKYNVKKDKIKVKKKKTDLNFMHEFYLSKKYITSLITDKKDNDDEGNNDTEKFLQKQREIKTSVNLLSEKIDSLQEELVELRRVNQGRFQRSYTNYRF